MNKWYVQVTGSYDDKFVGPFSRRKHAARYAYQTGVQGWVTRILTKQEFDNNVRDFGPIVFLEEPEHV